MIDSANVCFYFEIGNGITLKRSCMSAVECVFNKRVNLKVVLEIISVVFSVSKNQCESEKIFLCLISNLVSYFVHVNFLNKFYKLKIPLNS